MNRMKLVSLRKDVPPSLNLPEQEWNERGQKTTQPVAWQLNVRGACIRVCVFLPDQVRYFSNMELLLMSPSQET